MIPIDADKSTLDDVFFKKIPEKIPYFSKFSALLLRLSLLFIFARTILVCCLIYINSNLNSSLNSNLSSIGLAKIFNPTAWYRTDFSVLYFDAYLFTYLLIIIALGIYFFLRQQQPANAPSLIDETHLQYIHSADQKPLATHNKTHFKQLIHGCLAFFLRQKADLITYVVMLLDGMLLSSIVHAPLFLSGVSQNIIWLMCGILLTHLILLPLNQTLIVATAISMYLIVGYQLPYDYVLACMFFSILLACILHQQQTMYLAVARQAYETGLQQLSQLIILQDSDDGFMLCNQSGHVLSHNLAADCVIHNPLAMLQIKKCVQDAIPTSFLLSAQRLHVRILPISNHTQTQQQMHSQLAWLSHVNAYIHTNVLKKYLHHHLHHCCLVQIEHDEKYQRELKTQKLAYMGQLAANIAHEIRNPLATIKHAAELLFDDLNQNQNLNLNQSDIENATHAFHNKLKHMIMHHTNRIDQIIHQVLDASKPTKSELETTNLADLLKKIVHDWRLTQFNQLHGRDALHSTSIEEMIHYIHHQTSNYVININPKQFEQMICNLLDNAWRFSTRTPFALCICLRKNIRYNNLIELWILNDGPDISKADQIHLFEPFFSKRPTEHAAQTTNEATNEATNEGTNDLPLNQTLGTGLGLYIVRTLCIQNKCTIEYTLNQDIPFKAHYGFVLRFKSDAQ